MKFARTIRFDKSDLNIFPLASEEGELAVVGTFNFYNFEPEDLKGKVKQAFSNGFMGCKTFGYSTLVSLVHFTISFMTSSLFVSVISIFPNIILPEVNMGKLKS